MIASQVGQGAMMASPCQSILVKKKWLLMADLMCRQYYVRKQKEVWEEIEGSDERKRLEQQFSSEMVEWKKHTDDKKSDAVIKHKKSSVGGRDSMGLAKVEEGIEKSRAEVKGKEKEKGDARVKEDPERMALLHKLSALSASLTVC